MRSISVSRKGGKLDPSRHGEVEVDQDVDRDESREYTGVRSRVAARLVTPTPAAVPCGRAAPAGGRGTAAATSTRDATMREIPGKPVHSSAGTPGGFAMSTSPATSAGSTLLGALPAPARWLNRRHLSLRRTRWIIVVRLSWEGGLLTS